MLSFENLSDYVSCINQVSLFCCLKQVKQQYVYFENYCWLTRFGFIIPLLSQGIGILISGMFGTVTGSSVSM